MVKLYHRSAPWNALAVSTFEEKIIIQPGWGTNNNDTVSLQVIQDDMQIESWKMDERPLLIVAERSGENTR
jgi:hypothetical protein